MSQNKEVAWSMVAAVAAVVAALVEVTTANIYNNRL
jgi:hypothetical protein